jgi:hypothetical protein
MPKLGLGSILTETSPVLRPPQSAYTGTNVLAQPRLDTFPNTNPIVEQYNNDTAGISVVSPGSYALPWSHYSPTFTTTSEYKSLGPKFFLYDYVPYDPGYTEKSGHIIKLYGITNRVLSFNTLDRGYPNPPMRQITSDTTGSGSSTQNWVKYEMYQVVNIPVGATSVKFGAMVLVPESDALRPYNFGGFYVFAGNSPTISVDYAAVLGSSVPTLPASGFPYYVNYVETTSSSLYMFAGPPIDPVNVNRWNSSLYLKGISQASSNFKTWKQVNVSIPLPLGGSGSGVDNSKLGFSLYFAESHSYLLNPGSPPGPATGSIWFYDPYVVFS